MTRAMSEGGQFQSSRHGAKTQECRLNEFSSCTQSIMALCIDSCSWRRSTVVERRSLTGELSLSCARPAADG